VNILNFGFLDFLSLIVDFALITAPGIIEDIFSTFLLLPEAVIMETLALKAVHYTASGYEDWRRWGYLIGTTFAILGVFLGGTVFFHYFLEDYE
jgi:hypothetical protein